MKATFLIYLVIFLISFKFTAGAQQKTATNADSVFKPKIGSFDAGYSYSPFTVKNKNMNIRQVNASVNVPLINNFRDGKLDFLLAGVSYSGLSLSGTGKSFGGTDFYSISVPITFQKSFSAKYALLVSAIPTLSSDLKDVSGEDMLYSGFVMLKIRKSKTFSYAVGAGYSRQFFGTILLPVIGIEWQISEKLSLSGTLPVSEKLKYQLNDKSIIGFSSDFGIGGGSYRLSKKTGSNYLQVQQYKNTLFYNYQLAKNFSVQISGGYNFVQQLDLYNKDQKVNWAPFNDLNKRVHLAELKKTGFTVESGISYRF
ncbi:hypothetical protein DIU31_028640 [Mucilaginibacter rubeus]|uniref:DUF6268 domain-containing protein n=1 Tax=Mucilaginibacter rubeus TaxID=2027860 RepID=A0AAE6JK78_9SPHI|nr:MULTISPECIES: DUF6268 family outer membrane beta-barrel protein [Mucilaginibacter]QEM07274.1 hypothetical protein DIU31_028640 [Mucilaginibacter rubeus]QEM19729.1 hypothetical protein DIU38_028215 [Mucilaginibacter gossypii]QTE43572.1 hypothetical protein J3L19_32410 [Mucilaginibacter rubeus]QTE50172.1 hypothetical protein J3L21_32365 [Mucilaginibacter rubeus]QTE55260.1 hypothetical protein J3L23_23985 [Mucilaginibacter rubeus]